MKVSTAVACLAVVIIGLTAGSFARQRTILLNEIPIDIPPQVLAAKARDIAKSLGYTERPVDTAFGWEYDTDYLRFLAAEKNDSVRQARIKANRPPAVYFWYRESPRYLFHPTGSSITRTTPAPVEPGMLETVLDSEGRLVEFHARPPAQSREQDLTHTPDWSLLFAAAGLNSGGFTPAQPVLTPESFSDTRAAWTGSLEHAPTELVRVEAAAYQGRPVFFRSAGPWTRLSPTPPFSLGNFTFAFLLLFAVVLPVSVGLLAWRNTRFGRGDRRGAFRLGAFAFICSALKDIAWQHHVPSMSEVVSLLFALRDALTFCACFWLLYVAFEPYVRKRSPATLISWSRLLAGRLRDPLIGADLLAGCVLGIMTVCVALPLKSPFVASLVPRLPPTIASWLAYWSWLSVNAVFAALTFVFLMTLLLLLARLQWLAALLFVLVMSLALAVSGATLSAVILALLLLYAVMRFGVLTTAALLYCYDIVVVFPPPVNPSAWYTQGSLAAFLSILALAVYAFHTTLAGRPIWQDKI
jgi:hypothetical protein